MGEDISKKNIETVLSHALKSNIIKKEDSAVIFYDLTDISHKIKKALSLFPADTLHTAAVKAAPLINLIKYMRENKLGAEAASLPEVYMSQKAGVMENKIVFDSPAKTKEELEYALRLNCHINADSLEELELIRELTKKIPHRASFGLRVNPQVGTGTIAITSVAGDYSKFGVPLKEFRKEIINSFIKYDFLSGIHVHVGSQGCPLNLLISGIKEIYNLAVEINEELKSCGRAIKFFDLGGGLPVKYRSEDTPFTINEYAAALNENIPGLMNGSFNLITEFGRYYFANSAFAVSRIDSIKKQKGANTIISHLGADFLIRRVYNPDYWHHDFSIYDRDGKCKNDAEQEKYVIGGPLCFAGDVLAKDIVLPVSVTGDYLAIHDCGAYTLSMWSRYNSRQIPKVIGFYNNGEKFVILKERETLEDVARFWS